MNGAQGVSRVPHTACAGTLPINAGWPWLWSLLQRYCASDKRHGAPQRSIGGWSLLLTCVTLQRGGRSLNHVSMSPEHIQKHPALVQIAAAIGDEGTLRLVSAFGGRSICPSYACLESVIGADAARRLASELGRCEVYIPLGRWADIQERNAHLIASFDAMTKAGKSARQTVAVLASEFDLSDRGVWRILKRGAG